MHLTDALIQSDLHCIQGIHSIGSCIHRERMRFSFAVFFFLEQTAEERQSHEAGVCVCVCVRASEWVLF